MKFQLSMLSQFTLFAMFWNCLLLYCGSLKVNGWYNNKETYTFCTFKLKAYTHKNHNTALKGLYIWALSQENLSSGGCKQQRRRLAWSSAQSDQHHCYSLNGKYHIQTCYEQNFKFLASLCSWAGWFESHFVRNPEDRFSSIAAHIWSHFSSEKVQCFHMNVETRYMYLEDYGSYIFHLNRCIPIKCYGIRECFFLLFCHFISLLHCSWDQYILHKIIIKRIETTTYIYQLTSLFFFSVINVMSW